MSDSAAASRLPRRPHDRRAALSALALLLVVLGALGAGLVVYRSGHRTDVLVASHQITAGQRVKASDFAVARVASDTNSLVPAADQGNFIGTYATTTIPAGTLVNRLMFQVGNVIPSDGVVVGVSLSRSQRPAAPVATGDVVRAYLVVKNSTSAAGAPPSQVLVDAARVVGVSSVSSSSDTVTVSLLVTRSGAPALIAAAGDGAVSIGELPKAAKPTIDFVKNS